MSVALLPHTFEVKFKDNDDNFEWFNNWDNSSNLNNTKILKHYLKKNYLDKYFINYIYSNNNLYSNQIEIEEFLNYKYK